MIVVICPSNYQQRLLCKRRLPPRRDNVNKNICEKNRGIYCVYRTRKECASYLTSRFPQKKKSRNIHSGSFSFSGLRGLFAEAKDLGGCNFCLVLFPCWPNFINYSNSQYLTLIREGVPGEENWIYVWRVFVWCPIDQQYKMEGRKCDHRLHYLMIPIESFLNNTLQT